MLSEIIDSSGRVMDAVAEIRDSSREQNSGIQQVNNAVSQMDEITQQNAALVEEASAAMQSVNNEVEGMVEKLAFFQVGAAAQPGAAAVTLASSNYVVTRASSVCANCSEYQNKKIRSLLKFTPLGIIIGVIFQVGIE